MADRCAVITGAGGGIGAVMAREASAAGYSVIAWDESEATMTELAELGIARAAVDVTDEASIDAALAQVPGTLSVMVNCAGVNEAGALLDVEADRWRRVLDINLTGTFLCARAAARKMQHAGGGNIVNIASLAGLATTRNTASYSASKAAVIRLTEQMAIEWAPLGIRVNAVAPGLIAAGLSLKAQLPPHVEERRNAKIPLGRPGRAEDIAAAVLFLSSDAAQYITGETLLVDGGLTRTAVSSLPTRYD